MSYLSLSLLSMVREEAEGEKGKGMAGLIGGVLVLASTLFGTGCEGRECWASLTSGCIAVALILN